MKETKETIKNKWNEVSDLLGPDKKFNTLYILFYIFIIVSGIIGVLSPLLGLGNSIQVILMAAPVGAAISMSYNAIIDKFKQLKEEKRQSDSLEDIRNAIKIINTINAADPLESTDPLKPLDPKDTK